MGEPVEFEFEKLIVYQEARAFRRRIYRLAKLLPGYEFKLGAQMRDAARSLTNCLAEGYGRYTFKDRIHFCRESRGSLLELVDDINLCDDEKYARHDHLEDLRGDAAKLLKRLNGYIKYLNVEAEKLVAGRKRRSTSTPPDAPEM
jgi:four helix bundle protein